MLSTVRRQVGRVGIKDGDFAAEISEVILADGEIEHLVDDGEKVSQRANRTEGRRVDERPGNAGQGFIRLSALTVHLYGVPGRL